MSPLGAAAMSLIELARGYRRAGDDAKAADALREVLRIAPTAPAGPLANLRAEAERLPAALKHVKT